MPLKKRTVFSLSLHSDFEWQISSFFKPLYNWNAFFYGVFYTNRSQQWWQVNSQDTGTIVVTNEHEQIQILYLQKPSDMTHEHWYIQISYLQEPNVMTNEHGQIQVRNSYDRVDDVYHAIDRLNVWADDASLHVAAPHVSLYSQFKTNLITSLIRSYQTCF